MQTRSVPDGDTRRYITVRFLLMHLHYWGTHNSTTVVDDDVVVVVVVVVVVEEHAAPPKKPPRPGAPGHLGSLACLSSGDSYNDGLKVHTHTHTHTRVCVCVKRKDYCKQQ